MYNVYMYICIHSVAGATKANYIPQLLHNYNKRHFGLILYSYTMQYPANNSVKAYKSLRYPMKSLGVGCIIVIQCHFAVYQLYTYMQETRDTCTYILVYIYIRYIRTCVYILDTNVLTGNCIYICTYSQE